MPGNDPTTRPRDFHDWLRWYEQQRGGSFADIELACDATYGLALDRIVEFTGSATPAGLLGALPAVIPPEEIELRRLTATLADERHGAYMLRKWVPILNPRFPGVGPAYGSLTFRLAMPKAFDGTRPPPRRPIPKSALIALLRDDEVFQRHRAEKRLPDADLLQAEAKDRFPDLAVPRDSRLRAALKELSGGEMYGPPRRGPPPAWAKALRESISRKSNTSP